MSTLHLISLFSNILLGGILVYLVFKKRIYTFIYEKKENRRETERQRIRQVVEEVIKEIIKDDE
jgi:hypothetical protein